MNLRPYQQDAVDTLRVLALRQRLQDAEEGVRSAEYAYAHAPTATQRERADRHRSYCEGVANRLRAELRDLGETP